MVMPPPFSSLQKPGGPGNSDVRRGTVDICMWKEENKNERRLEGLWLCMKRLLVFCLVVLLLTPAAKAAEAEEAAYPFEMSDWAREDAEKAMELLDIRSPHVINYSDLSLPIYRFDFAQKAASLAAAEFGSNMESYLLVMNYRGQAEHGPSFSLSALDVAKSLGIIEGRGDGDWDAYSSVTRQEAAVMLARTYRACGGSVPGTLTPLSFADQADIADWALEDVRLMNQLGIMTGVGDGRFDPLGSYSSEQCLVTLLRLHETAPCDGSGQENPFAIPAWEGSFLKTFDNSNLAFAAETEEYYICAWTYTYGTGLGYEYYYIEIVDREDLSLRSYPTAIIRGSSWRGDYHVRPENPALSEDGARLTYTAAVEEDVYHVDFEGNREQTPMFLKGVYTVTMDLKTGEQTYTRADLDED